MQEVSLLNKRPVPYRKLEKPAQELRDNHPGWMDHAFIKNLHIDCDENGIHTLSVWQAEGQAPRIIAKYIETDAGIEELYVFPEEVENQMKVFMTAVEIGGLALQLARFRKANPNGKEVTVQIPVKKKCRHQGKTITAVFPLWFDDENDPCRIPKDWA